MHKHYFSHGFPSKIIQRIQQKTKRKRKQSKRKKQMLERQVNKSNY